MSEQDNKPIQVGDPATEPIDLAQAFKMYNQGIAAAAQGTMADAGNDDSDDARGTEESGEPVANGQEISEGNNEDPVSNGAENDDSAGGSANVIEPVDFNARRQELLQDVQRQAIAQVRQEFAKNQITPCTIEELYQRDEQTGRVTFKNPDDPQHDFASRAEAQAWVDAFNKQVEGRFRQEVNKKQRELVQQNAPQIRLLDFIPTFNGMNKAEQAVLDDLLEPYAVKDRNGNVVGFNVDLNAMAAQARKIAKRIPASEQPAEGTDSSKGSQGTQEQPSRPAMNMPTGTGASADETEPKSIGEALKMFDKQQREKGKKND